MKWQDEDSGGVDDRRGLGPAHYAGGGSIGLIVIALIGYFFFHIDPSRIMSAGAAMQQNGAPAAAQCQAGAQCPEGDTECLFADKIHHSTDKIWAAYFEAHGQTYKPSTITLYTAETNTGCGDGQAAMGPFYCPADQHVYLDLDFFNTLEKQLGASGDFAKAYVIAHEVGHHVQNLLGTSDKVSQLQARLDERGANAASVKLELQADCFAGVWAKQSDSEKHWLDAGDIDEAMGAAAAVGDDTLQKETQGRVVPDSFTHGTSAQRKHWFMQGFDSGDPNQCDTFAQ